MLSLESLKQYARERYIPVMLDDTRELLFNTVRQRLPKRILEIGTAIGYSGIIMLTASPNAVLNTIEFSEQSVALPREVVPLLTGKYNFIFLDGPKGQYKYFYPYLTDLLEVNGTLVCDNVLYKGLVEHIPDNKRHKHITVARNMREFLDELTADKRYQTELHRIGDGVTVSTKISE